jgi:hypothetical protein
MRASKPRVLDPQDVETICRVYEAAWAAIIARGPLRDTKKDRQRQEALRNWLFEFAGSGPIDFNTLYNKALPHWTTTSVDDRSPPPEV